MIKILLSVIALCIVAVSVFVGVMWANEWTPSQIQNLNEPTNRADTIKVDTLKIISWNIGYAGLGDDMDFFMDGGTKTRCSEQRTKANLAAITDFLSQHQDADFILLQEVDIDSKRSYYIDELEEISKSLPGFYHWVGLNYVCGFVPMPIAKPLGKVKAGVVTFSKYRPVEVSRLQYPGEFGFPERLFNLKRCAVSAAFAVNGTDGLLYVNNTHNSAYDSGGMREMEMGAVRDLMSRSDYSITAGDWNCNPPQYKASARELNDPHFNPLPLSYEDFEGYRFMADTSTRSARYLDQPFSENTITTILDFAIIAKGIEPISVETINLGFRNSDHNPVVIRVSTAKDKLTE